MLLLQMLAEESSAGDVPAELEVGWAGRLFGAGYAGSNIAGIVIVASLGLLAAERFAPSHESSELIIGSTVSMITLALGYLFGSSRRRA